MQTFKLKSQNPVPQVDLRVNLEVRDSFIFLEYHLVDTEKSVTLESFTSEQEQRDGLWNKTCFEFFGSFTNKSYDEYNFSSAGHWKFYHFKGYRNVDHDKTLEALPFKIKRTDYDSKIIVSASLPFKEYSLFYLSAVLLTKANNKSYYALSLQAKPDFHQQNEYFKFTPFP